MSSVALVGNGVIGNHSLIQTLLKHYDRIIAVDGGLLHCREMGITPDLILGDFDSVSPEILALYADIPTEVFPKDKDYSDMELAIRAADQPGVERIALFGAMEKRTDHALSNLQLMRRQPEKILIETEKETLFCVTKQKTLNCRPGQVVSLIPIGSPPKTTTHGLKWELQGETLDKNFFSLSNICLGKEFSVSVENGDLICCMLRDKGQ